MINKYTKKDNPVKKIYFLFAFLCSSIFFFVWQGTNLFFKAIFVFLAFNGLWVLYREVFAEILGEKYRRFIELYKFYKENITFIIGSIFIVVVLNGGLLKNPIQHLVLLGLGENTQGVIVDYYWESTPDGDYQMAYAEFQINGKVFGGSCSIDYQLEEEVSILYLPINPNVNKAGYLDFKLVSSFLASFFLWIILGIGLYSMIFDKKKNY